MLIISLILMGVSTTLIGALPGYESMGIMAPVLLVFLRLLQGFGAGAEFGGAIVISAEYAPRSKKGLFASMAQVGSEIGFLLSTAAFRHRRGHAGDAMLAWGWRVPFLIGIVPVIVGLWLRLRVEETPEYKQVKVGKKQPRVPILEFVRTAPKDLLLAASARLMDPPLGYLYTVFVTVYAVDHVGIGEQTILTGLLIASGAGIFTVMFFGHLTDRFGTRRVYLFAAAFAAAFLLVGQHRVTADHLVGPVPRYLDR